MEDDFELDSLFLSERRCRVCGEIKDLMYGFYLSHKNSVDASSAYSYECKSCTIKRITKKRKNKKNELLSDYPDW